ncbi:bacteriohemerythrin [Anaerohalosphaeraceae bacterium U12dextr]
MGFIQWQDSFSVGVPAMDIQHKQLVAMVNQLYEAMRTSKGDAVVQTILPSLVQYTKTHFNSEEKLMHEAGYPDIAAHQALHHKLAMQVGDLMDKIKSGKMVPTVSVATFLKDWLVNHIQGQDKHYGAFIAQHQLVGAAR